MGGKVLKKNNVRDGFKSNGWLSPGQSISRGSANGTKKVNRELPCLTTWYPRLRKEPGQSVRERGKVEYSTTKGAAIESFHLKVVNSDVRPVMKSWGIGK